MRGYLTTAVAFLARFEAAEIYLPGTGESASKDLTNIRRTFELKSAAIGLNSARTMTLPVD